MKKIRKTNPNLVELIHELKKNARENEAPIWRDVARRLEAPSRNWAQVNVSRIARYAADNETIVIAGKLLGAGEIDKKVTIAAYRSSESARKKIESAGGRLISLAELVKENPKGSNIRIMG